MKLFGVKLDGRQIKAFVKYVTDDSIKVKFSTTHEPDIVASIILDRKHAPILELNSVEFNSIGPRQKYACILHEIGHVYVGYKSAAVDELNAHLWAMRMCRKHRWKSIYKELVCIIDSWQHYEDRKFYRYLLAARLFKSKGIHRKME